MIDSIRWNVKVMETWKFARRDLRHSTPFSIRDNVPRSGFLVGAELGGMCGRRIRKPDRVLRPNLAAQTPRGRLLFKLASVYDEIDIF